MAVEDRAAGNPEGRRVTATTFTAIRCRSGPPVESGCHLDPGYSHRMESIEAGLIQRAQLLNWILADLWVPRNCSAAFHIPPSHRVRRCRFLAGLRQLPPGTG